MDFGFVFYQVEDLLFLGGAGVACDQEGVVDEVGVAFVSFFEVRRS